MTKKTKLHTKIIKFQQNNLTKSYLINMYL